MAIPPDPTPPDYAPRPRIANATLRGSGCVTPFFEESVLQPAYLAAGGWCIGQVDIFWYASALRAYAARYGPSGLRLSARRLAPACQHASAPSGPRCQPNPAAAAPIRTRRTGAGGRWVPELAGAARDDWLKARRSRSVLTSEAEGRYVLTSEGASPSVPTSGGEAVACWVSVVYIWVRTFALLERSASAKLSHRFA